MKLPLSWLKGWVDPGLAPRELGDRMTLAGFELESIASAAPAFSGVVVAEILSAERHPQADKLQVCSVSIGGTELQIVCGAANARAGLRTALAQVGAVLPGDLKIKAAKLRGVESAGMLCSAKELGLAEVSDGILELPADLALGADLRAVLDLDDPLSLPEGGFGWPILRSMTRALSISRRNGQNILRFRLPAAEFPGAQGQNAL